MERATGHVDWFLSPDPELWLGCTIWAPSGNRVACVGFGEVPPRPERNGIYSIRVSDGQGLTRITKNPGGEDGPLAYSPDGRQLLFNRLDPARPESANQALFVTSLTGGQPRRITPWGFSDDWADWSPDGRTIVFGTHGFLYRVSPNGNGLAKIQLQTADSLSARTAFDVSFSPDGSSIVFSVFRPPGIYTARPDGSDVQRLTNSPTEDHHADWGAAPGT
jgi:Tol biopolymer transport system component